MISSSQSQFKKIKKVLEIVANENKNIHNSNENKWKIVFSHISQQQKKKNFLKKVF